MAIHADRRQGFNSSFAFKAPCRVASTANISAFEGFQTIDGVLPTSSDTEAMRRILVKEQTDAAENGIYVMTEGPWLRAKDFDSHNDFVQGTRVFVHSGTTSSGTFVLTSAVPSSFNMDADDITFTASAAVDINFGSFTELLTPDPATDFLTIFDTSASTTKKVKPENLFKYHGSGSAAAPAIAAEAFLTTGIYWDTGILGFSIGGVGEVALSATALYPVTSGGNALGSVTNMWSSAFFASGAVLNFNAGDITVAHAADVLAFAGGSYTFAGAVTPASDGGSSLGTTTLGWQNLFANTGFVLNIENGNWVATHTSGVLNVTTGDLRITTPGTDPESVVTYEQIRERLTANRTYYVRSDGSNSNTGLADTAGGAWATPQYASDFIGTYIDIAGYRVLVQVRSGSYAGVYNRPYVGGGIVYFQGDPTTPSNCILGNALSPSGFNIGSFNLLERTATSVWINGFRCTPTAGPCLDSDPASAGDNPINIGNPVDFSNGAMEWAGNQASSAVLIGNIVDLGYTQLIDGAALNSPSAFINTLGNSSPFFASTITITGTPAFSTAFFFIGSYSVLQDFATYVGSATGRRYRVRQGGEFLCTDPESGPGDTAGVIESNSAAVYTGSDGVFLGTVKDDRHNVTVAGGSTQLTNLQSGKHIDNVGASSRADLTLPNAQVDLEYTFIVSSANGIRVIAKAGDTIQVRGTTTAAAGNIESLVPGDIIRLKGISTTEWVAVFAFGAWAGTETITVANEASDTSCFIAFFTAASGALQPKTNANLTFNASTGVLTSASLVATTADINGGTVDGAVIGGSSPAAITGTTVTASTGFLPDANDGAYLGQAGTAFSDLFLAEGAVISWDSGDVTITQTGDLLNFAGASTAYAFDAPVVAGHTTALSIFTSSGRKLQVFDNNATGGSIAIGMFDSVASSQPHILFYRSRNTTIGDATVVQDGDALGGVFFAAAQQTGTFATQTLAAGIRAEVDGTVTSGAGSDMPGRLVISTTADGSGTPTDRLIFDSSGAMKPAANDGLALGTVTRMFSDLFLASGAVVNFNNGDVVVTHSAGILTMGTGELRITTPGTNAASVVTVGGTQTLSNKSIDLASNTLTGTAAQFNTALTGDNFATMGLSAAVIGAY